MYILSTAAATANHFTRATQHMAKSRHGKNKVKQMQFPGFELFICVAVFQKQTKHPRSSLDGYICVCLREVLYLHTYLETYIHIHYTYTHTCTSLLAGEVRKDLQDERSDKCHERLAFRSPDISISSYSGKVNIFVVGLLH